MHSIWIFKRRDPEAYSAVLPESYLCFCERCGKEVLYWGSKGVPRPFCDDDCNERMANVATHDCGQEHESGAFGIPVWIDEGVEGAVYGTYKHCQDCDEEVKEIWAVVERWEKVGETESLAGTKTMQRLVGHHELVRSGRGAEISCAQGRMRKALGDVE